MSKIEVKVPSPGESISEVIIANWLVKNGDYVENGQVMAKYIATKPHSNWPLKQVESSK